MNDQVANDQDALLRARLLALLDSHAALTAPKLAELVQMPDDVTTVKRVLTSMTEVSVTPTDQGLVWSLTASVKRRLADLPRAEDDTTEDVDEDAQQSDLARPDRTQQVREVMETLSRQLETAGPVAKTVWHRSTDTDVSIAQVAGRYLEKFGYVSFTDNGVTLLRTFRAADAPAFHIKIADWSDSIQKKLRTRRRPDMERPRGKGTPRSTSPMRQNETKILKLLRASPGGIRVGEIAKRVGVGTSSVRALLKEHPDEFVEVTDAPGSRAGALFRSVNAFAPTPEPEPVAEPVVVDGPGSRLLDPDEPLTNRTIAEELHAIETDFSGYQSRMQLALGVEVEKRTEAEGRLVEMLGQVDQLTTTVQEITELAQEATRQRDEARAHSAELMSRLAQLTEDMETDQVQPDRVGVFAPPTYLQSKLGRRTVLVCGSCGSFVGDQNQHDTWHQQLGGN